MWLNEWVLGTSCKNTLEDQAFIWRTDPSICIYIYTHPSYTYLSICIYIHPSYTYLSMYIYIYIYICIHICKYLCIYKYIYMYVYKYAYIYICVCIHMYVYIYIYIHINNTRVCIEHNRHLRLERNQPWNSTKIDSAISISPDFLPSNEGVTTPKADQSLGPSALWLGDNLAAFIFRRQIIIRTSIYSRFFFKFGHDIFDVFFFPLKP